MQTAKDTNCQGSHDYNLHGRDWDRWHVTEINGRRYTCCAHKVGENGYCGKLIDITDGPRVLCCGDERNHY